jgi:hypothetical protein
MRHKFAFQIFTTKIFVFFLFHNINLFEFGVGVKVSIINNKLTLFAY